MSVATFCAFCVYMYVFAKKYTLFDELFFLQIIMNKQIQFLHIKLWIINIVISVSENKNTKKET